METQSQTIKNILELCESFGVPAEVVSLIRKKCWYLADSNAIVTGKQIGRAHV